MENMWWIEEMATMCVILPHKKKKIFFTLISVLILSNSYAKKPKLVVGIVVDQMRFDYVDRFWSDFERILKGIQRYFGTASAKTAIS